MGTVTIGNKVRQGRWVIVLAVFYNFLLATQAQAGYFEISANGSYSSSYYGDSNYSWSRRWGGSIGYYVAALSQIQFSAQDIFTRTSITSLQDTTFHDQVYSIDFVQAIFPKSFGIQPYVKLGVGQLNREAVGSYSNGLSPPLIVDSLTAVLGAGLRIFLFSSMALRAEGTTYLTDGKLSTWQNNFGITAGFSFYF